MPKHSRAAPQLVFQIAAGSHLPVDKVPFPRDYFASPQFYRGDMELFASNPRQVQCPFVGITYYPLEMVHPELSEEQVHYSQWIHSCVQAMDFYMMPQHLEDELERQQTQRLNTFTAEASASNENSGGGGGGREEYKLREDQKVILAPQQRREGPRSLTGGDAAAHHRVRAQQRLLGQASV